MTGTKALFLEDYCRRRGRAYVRFDYFGHGASSGEITEGTIGRWRVGMVHDLDKRRARWAAGYDVVIHGHTHRWRDEVVGRTRFINPGTATRPQFGGTERTMARLTFGNELVVEKLMLPKFARTPAI